MIGAVSGVTLLVLWATGGLATAPRPEPEPATVRVVAAEESVDLGPATVTVTRVTAIDDLGPIVGPPREGNRFLAVSVRVAVTDQRTWNAAADSVIVGDVPGLADLRPDARLISGSQRADSLQPGLPRDIAVIFQQARTSPVPATVTVTLNCWQRLTRSLGDWVWVDAQPCARVTLTTNDRSAPAAPSPSGEAPA